eukprot:CAMPEP_0195146004 /NCGR_PEP_ID=MMETSP0448-20130528/170883_1 /TAXON_ID=66468 /ORGANISM="Heterocapsa triquestra, Strain CCMP 448" /LENGTH=182 /DNA_ID=CAMNT_0040184539 /DNA_START=24 /DNA_END=568 /DNA_ORIENTATION=-
MWPVLLGSPQYHDEPTPEMQEKLRKIRFCVVGVFVAAVGRLCTGDVPFNELLCGIMGIFLLKGDDNVGTCYACLASSPVGLCAGPSGGGLGCLMPFLFISSFNCIFLALRLLYGGPFLLVSFAAQFAGATFAWRLNTLVNAATPGAFDASREGQPLNQPLAERERVFPQGGPGGNDMERAGG